MLQAQEETVQLDEEVSILNEKLGNTEAQLRNAQAEIQHQLEENGELKELEENGELKSHMFCIHNLSGDESILFYTGFTNLQSLLTAASVITISAVSRETVSSALDVMSLLT